MLNSVRIVLVRPMGPTNLGGVCRAMLNMGLHELVLVAPRCDPSDPQAYAYATRAGELLASARIVRSIPEAIADCALTIAATAKGGHYRRQAGITPFEAAGCAQRTARDGGRTAIVFGPEDRGLTIEEVLLLDRVLTIPANPEYPVLNLAAAALIVCYELFQAEQRSRGEPPIRKTGALADDRRKSAMFERLFAALERIGFFRTQHNPDHLKFAFRHLLGRAEMTVNEADIFIGLAQQILHTARDGGDPKQT